MRWSEYGWRATGHGDPVTRELWDGQAAVLADTRHGSLLVALRAVMRELAAAGSHGAHRLPLVDLTVAVAAQRSGLAILHHDKHFDRLSDTLGVRALWIGEPSD